MINQQSPFIQKAASVTNIMLMVILALVPGLIFYVYFFGVGVLLNVFVASLTALITEYFVLKMRKLPPKVYLSDGSALVAAWLLALSIPSIAPWWIIIVGTFFTIVIAKHFYGGLGSNIFNPAMIGYAVLLISFPAIMTKWPSPIENSLSMESIRQALQVFFYGLTQVGDGLTSATPLDYIKTELLQGQILPDITIPNAGLVTILTSTQIISLAYLLGGIVLLHKKIISWHLPITYLLSLAFISGLFHLIDPNNYSTISFHLLNGGTMLCAFFIITDPVSGPTTPKGKIWFAFMVAILVYVIRVFGGYPEGIAFAVIFMNICVPLIDNLTQPKVFGHG
tara:strand:+ start:2105 stop:3118 length:1014 start_codon:yes stop_codon:yes gene_type:complete